MERKFAESFFPSLVIINTGPELSPVHGILSMSGELVVTAKVEVDEDNATLDLPRYRT